ncbi:MAG: hypothetical protein IPM18_08530 [Phycisphaerales bacterium]|nr:hypothetical protein [Phycisphaerales bacterium]
MIVKLDRVDFRQRFPQDLVRNAAEYQVVLAEVEHGDPLEGGAASQNDRVGEDWQSGRNDWNAL